MPYIIRPPRKRTLLAAVTTAVVSLAALPGLAQASTVACPSEEAAQTLLAAYGDNHEYTILPGSRFNGALTDWTLRDASVVKEETVNPVTGSSHSLVIAPGGEVVTPAFCVSSEIPSFRFFSRRLSAGFGGLSVSLRYKNDLNWLQEVMSGTVNAGSSWELTPVLGLGSVLLPLWQHDATLKVQLVFRAAGYGSSWAIDDVFIDPYRK